MFVDASAVVAIVTSEPGHLALTRILDGVRNAITSPLAIWESAAAIARKSTSSAREELQVVMDFLLRAGVTVEPVDLEIAEAALAAFDRYGRRSGHPAKLNMGDCFAYAFAKRHGIPLLYTGDDFGWTDVSGNWTKV